MLQQMTAAGVDLASVKAVVDLGCATGLSTLALQRLFPGASLTGVDLSPHFLAVGRHLQQQREVRTGQSWQNCLGQVAGIMQDTVSNSKLSCRHSNRLGSKHVLIDLPLQLAPTLPPSLLPPSQPYAQEANLC
jgi:SAM-dependent methyltransferase